MNLKNRSKDDNCGNNRRQNISKFCLEFYEILQLLCLKEHTNSAFLLDVNVFPITFEKKTFTKEKIFYTKLRN